MAKPKTGTTWPTVQDAFEETKSMADRLEKRAARLQRSLSYLQKAADAARKQANGGK